ncbi:MAG: M48 family metallopeptidase [Alsobacter sp.]
MTKTRPFRRLAVALAAMALLAACGRDAVAPSDAAIEAARAEIARSAPREPLPIPPERAASVVRRAEAAVRPAAEAVCRERGASPCAWDVAFRPGAEFNAFATGDNDVVMLGGVVALARSEAEVAMVLAHEKAHHILDHVEQSGARAGLGALLADMLVRLGATWLAEGLGLPLPQGLVDVARRTAAGAGAQAGALVFSVAQEREADALAAEILARSGIDPAQARGMVLAMGVTGRGDGTPALLRTHPAGPERLAHWDAVTEELRRRVPALAGGE